MTELPRKRVGAGVLLRNRIGQVLLVEPTYKDDWEIPGGLVEDGESPREAARRECLEELGTAIPIGDLLCVHYCHGPDSTDDGVMFVFDGGTTSTDARAFTLPADELQSARFVDMADLASHVVPMMATRLTASIDALEQGETIYLER